MSCFFLLICLSFSCQNVYVAFEEISPILTLKKDLCSFLPLAGTDSGPATSLLNGWDDTQIQENQI